jgi:hypothetical protein
MHLMERQRLEGAPVAVRDSLQAVLAVLEEQVAAVEQQIKEHIGHHPDLKRRHDLLESIPGVGAVSAATLLAELGDVSLFRSARQVVAITRRAGTRVSPHASMSPAPPSGHAPPCVRRADRGCGVRSTSRLCLPCAATRPFVPWQSDCAPRANPR